MGTIIRTVVSFLGKEGVELTRQCHKRTYWSVQKFSWLDLVVVYTCVSNCQSPSNHNDACNWQSLKLCLNQSISGQCLSWACKAHFPPSTLAPHSILICPWPDPSALVDSSGSSTDKCWKLLQHLRLVCIAKVGRKNISPNKLWACTFPEVKDLSLSENGGPDEQSDFSSGRTVPMMNNTTGFNTPAPSPLPISKPSFLSLRVSFHHSIRCRKECFLGPRRFQFLIYHVITCMNSK